MLAAGFELVADEADAVEVGAHRELLVLGLGLLGARRALLQRLRVQREGEGYVASDLPSMERAVEAAQLDGLVAVEEGVQVPKIM
jgi:hypothetical protein